MPSWPKPRLLLTGQRQWKSGFLRDYTYGVHVCGTHDGRQILRRHNGLKFPSPASGKFAYYNPQRRTLESRSGAVILSDASLST